MIRRIASRTCMSKGTTCAIAHIILERETNVIITLYGAASGDRAVRSPCTGSSNKVGGGKGMSLGLSTDLREESAIGIRTGADATYSLCGNAQRVASRAFREAKS